jgi:ubiquinone/menaquinone biosynthesis C-methylase UbiE
MKKHLFVRADALHLPLADESVDAVTGHSFLYLLPDHPIALSQAKHVFYPKGYVAFLKPHWLGPHYHGGDVRWIWNLQTYPKTIAA